MSKRKARAVWNGSISEGDGNLSVESGAFEGQKYSFASRFEDGTGTNPEELIGAAEAGCFSMALSLMLGEAGYTPDSIETTATVEIRKQGHDISIPGIQLECTAKIPGISEEEFKEVAENARANCPVSKALSGTNITLEAKLAE